jgi:hypothetical protein
MMGRATSLFGQDYPSGFQYDENFVTDTEEAALLDAIANITFSAFEMRGVIARRRVAFFGESYDRAEVEPVPDFLLPLRARIAMWRASNRTLSRWLSSMNTRPARRSVGTVMPRRTTSFRASRCFLNAACGSAHIAAPPRPAGRRAASHEIKLDRRSAYLMTGESRNSYEHSIPPVRALRYSVTFRTLRSSRPK